MRCSPETPRASRNYNDHPVSGAGAMGCSGTTWWTSSHYIPPCWHRPSSRPDRTRPSRQVQRITCCLDSDPNRRRSTTLRRPRASPAPNLGRAIAGLQACVSNLKRDDHGHTRCDADDDTETGTGDGIGVSGSTRGATSDPLHLHRPSLLLAATSTSGGAGTLLRRGARPELLSAEPPPLLTTPTSGPESERSGGHGRTWPQPGRGRAARAHTATCSSGPRTPRTPGVYRRGRARPLHADLRSSAPRPGPTHTAGTEAHPRAVHVNVPGG